MNTLKEIYKQLGKLLETCPEISDLNVDACGVPGSLFCYREDPDGIITGISYEDDSFISEHEGTAKEWLEALGVTTLSEQHMSYLSELPIV